MSYGKMPPQAYTKETLQEAFEWWSEQPEELRTKIQDKDDLVGYYLKFHGRQGSEKQGFTKAAKESFSSELKGLAKNLESFEGYQRPEPKPTGTPAPASVKSGGRHVFEPYTQMNLLNISKPAYQESEKPPAKLNLPQTVSASKPVKKEEPSFFTLDEKSKQSVKEVKERLNLSSDEEALRAVIALGVAKIKSLF